MPKMPTSELKAMLTAEKLDALAAMRASKLSAERAHAMDYYNGDMSRDMPAQEGRSRAVSTDVADTIDGLMPSLMEIFAGSDDVVRFEPFGPEDVAAAEQETDYVNHVFMQQNPGFLILYSFIKDALLSKVGIVKVWWEEREEESRETYLDQPDDAFALLVADPEVEIVAHSERPDPSFRPVATPPQMLPPRWRAARGAARPGRRDRRAGCARVGDACAGRACARRTGRAARRRRAVPMLHDVTVVTRKTVAQAHVQGVPPEEFGISRFARSLQRLRLLLPRGHPARGGPDRGRLRPRRDQGDPELHDADQSGGAGARYRRRASGGRRRRRHQRGQPADQDHRALRADGLRGQRQAGALPGDHRRRPGRGAHPRRRARDRAGRHAAVRRHDAGDRHPPLLRPLDRRPGDGHPAHQDRAAALDARQRLPGDQSAGGGGGGACHRDHARRPPGVAAGRHRAHQDAGRA